MMKTAKAIGRGFEAKFPFSYLNNMQKNAKKVCTASSEADFLNLDFV